ncbi:MAG: general secretion pathway protein GspK [Desulfobacterales bacterium]|nr:general secretion pathway protein GspK [Desulfobacterales bacterium]
MIRLIKNNKGFALILTILIISLIVALTLQFNISMRSELHAAANLRNSIKLGCIAGSGFECAIALLYRDALETDFDSLQDAWAKSDVLSSGSSSFFDEGRFEVEVTDLSGKIRINCLVNNDEDMELAKKRSDLFRDLFKRFLESGFGLETEADRAGIIDAIIDWIDSDSETELGAENSYYQTLETPYPCKNAPLESLEELLLIRGITKELYYGKDGRPGISDYLTIYGDGKVNINTADPLVLRALSDDIDKEMADDMAAYRKGRNRDLKDPGWYQDVPGMNHVRIDTELISTSSSHFEIESLSSMGDMSKRVRGTVERKKDGSLKIISWKVS